MKFFKERGARPSQHREPVPHVEVEDPGYPADPYDALGLKREDLRHEAMTTSTRDRGAVMRGEDEPFAARARMKSRAHSVPTPRRIWDIEDAGDAPSGSATNLTASLNAPHAASHNEPHNAPTPQPREANAGEDVARAREELARMARETSIPVGTSEPSGRTRAKTRLLGFQAHALAAEDPFARPQRPAGAAPVCFPVGWVVVVAGPGHGASFTLFSGVSSIGRGETQAVVLDFGDTSISRENHASIAYDDETNRFFLGQGGKSNIVRLNDRPVLSTEDLAHGDTIRIGETTLRFIAFCSGDFAWTPQGGTQPEVSDVAAE